MGVKEEPVAHGVPVAPSNAPRSHSGVSSKSAPMAIRPDMEPGTRGWDR